MRVAIVLRVGDLSADAVALIKQARGSDFSEGILLSPTPERTTSQLRTLGFPTTAWRVRLRRASAVGALTRPWNALATCLELAQCDLIICEHERALWIERLFARALGTFVVQCGHGVVAKRGLHYFAWRRRRAKVRPNLSLVPFQNQRPWGNLYQARHWAWNYYAANSAIDVLFQAGATPYVKPKKVAIKRLPRFDAAVLGRGLASPRRAGSRRIVFAPTRDWESALFSVMFRAPDIAAAASRSGLDVVVRLHKAKSEEEQLVDDLPTGWSLDTISSSIDSLRTAIILVTDTSSIAVEAALLDIPTIFYQPSTPILAGPAFWPGPVVATVGSLAQAIKDAAAGIDDFSEYRKQCRDLLIEDSDELFLDYFVRIMKEQQ